MIKKILIAMILMYALPMIAYEGATYYLQSNGHCVGDVCMKAECPDGYAIGIMGEGLLPCEKFEEYTETRDPNLLY